MKLYIADAFTRQVFGGNPAGVVILPEGNSYPPEETMRKTAAELRYSETAFIRPLEDSSFQLRYFTPAGEVDLCGHATVASFACLLDAGFVKDDSRYTAKTRAGDLTIRLQQGFVMMEMAPPRHIDTIQEPQKLSELYNVLGLDYHPVILPQRDSRITLLPQIISTGLPDIVLPVKSRADLSRIAPDFPALSRLSEAYRVTGVHAFTLDGESDGESCDVTARCRNFAPLYDIDEEAATGTASGALTWYLYCSGLISDTTECTFIQGEAMERPSRILTHIRAKGDSAQIQVGGNAAILAMGEIFL